MTRCACISGLVLVFLSGCGSGQPEAKTFETVPAAGTLTWNGKPLAGFRITLHPAGGEARTASGVTDDSGKFVLGTDEAGDGAVPGQHAIAVIWEPPADDGLGDVVEDPSKMPKPPVELPAQYASEQTSGKTVEIPAAGNTDLKIELE